MSFELTLALKKETKGTYVFATDEEGAQITQLYVRKEAFSEKPESIKIKVTS